MESPPAPAEREHPLARLARKQDIMKRTQRAVTLITAAIAALAPAAITAAAAASAPAARSTAQAVTAATRVTATIPVGRFPDGVAANPRTDTIYVTNEKRRGTVGVISGRTSTVVATIRVGRFPAGVAANPRTDTIYVTNFFSGT